MKKIIALLLALSLILCLGACGKKQETPSTNNNASTGNTATTTPTDTNDGTADAEDDLGWGMKHFETRTTLRSWFCTGEPSP